MTTKTLGIAAALAALCLVPAASAEWGPDVTVTVDPTRNVWCLTATHEETVGPVTVTEDDCVATVAFDGGNVAARCGPQEHAVGERSSVAVDRDCGVDVYAAS